MDHEGGGDNPNIGVENRVPRRRSLFVHPVFIGALLVAVCGFVQLWLDTGGRILVWPKQTIYYPVLADAFVHHQVSLRIKPLAGLVALPDPYDPIANQPYRWHDVAYYKGNYYLAWGPVPALLPALPALAGIDPPNFDDEGLCVTFLIGTVVMAVILISEMRSRLFPELGAWTVAPPVLALGLSAAMLLCADVYGAAIAGGQFFLLAGLCAAWFGLASRRCRPLWMMIAGICWAISAGSRSSLGPAIAAVAAFTAWQIWRGGAKPVNKRSPAKAIVSMTAPLIIGASLLAWYNYARFDSITEFGVHDQLTARNQHDGPASQLFSAGRVIPSLLRYVFEPPHLSKTFPFIGLRNDSNPSRLDQLLALPNSYGLDWLIGQAWSQPFLAFAVVLAYPLVRRRTVFPASNGSDKIRGGWLVIALMIGAFVGFLPALAFNSSAIRYLMDALPCVSILAALGYFWVLQTQNHRRLIEAAVVAVVVIQCLASVLTTLRGPADTFAVNNPNLYNAMVSFFSIR